MKKIGFLIMVMITLLLSSCEFAPQRGPVSSSGVEQATTKVETDADGNTVEQKNIMERLKRDNMPGSIKHLYIMSAYSGDVLIYSTVIGKVTSSGKRLTPVTVQGGTGWDYNKNSNLSSMDNRVTIGDKSFITDEVIQDDGTYGSSIEYLYWFDSKGIYHQQYITGGMIVHVSDQPIAVKSVILNLSSE